MILSYSTLFWLTTWPPLSPHPNAEIVKYTLSPTIPYILWDWSSSLGPHAGAASTVLAEPSSQPLVCLYFQGKYRIGLSPTPLNAHASHVSYFPLASASVYLAKVKDNQDRVCVWVPFFWMRSLMVRNRRMFYAPSLVFPSSP